jgi:small subunit ribosomal protein S9
MALQEHIAVGRRKTSTARVILRNGNGKITINDREGSTYFATENCFQEILLPLKKTNTFGTYDVHVNVDGGGFTGQVGAIKLGIARALININPDYKPTLKVDSLLTRDPRAVERKKYGQPKARKKFQFSKR